MRDNGRMVPSVRDILATRGGEEMALNDAHLNPQLGRIVRTLGFDKPWVRGEGAYLIDAAGDRYLDLLCGYGVFAVGRNHPDVIAALRDTMEAQTPNLPQLGVTLLQGVLAEQLIARAPDSIDALVAANSGAEAIEGAIKLSRAATGRSRVLFADHGFHGLTLGALSLNGNAEFRDGFGPLLPGCEAVPFGDVDALAAELGEPAALCFSPLPDVGLIRPVLDSDAEELLGSLRLGVGGPATAVRRVLPAMLARGAGSLLFTTGSGALRPDPARAASAVTTAATTTYVGLLRSALDGSGVRVGHTVVVGPVARGRADAHEPDDVAADLWRHHTGEAAASPTVLRLPDA